MKSLSRDVAHARGRCHPAGVPTDGQVARQPTDERHLHRLLSQRGRPACSRGRREEAGARVPARRWRADDHAVREPGQGDASDRAPQHHAAAERSRPGRALRMVLGTAARRRRSAQGVAARAVGAAPAAGARRLCKAAALVALARPRQRVSRPLRQPGALQKGAAANDAVSSAALAGRARVADR